MNRLLLLILLLTAVSVTNRAQDLNYLFQRLGSKDGLFEETVHSVQQDAKGFIWLNFRTLIQRYDGFRFISFYPGTQLPEGNIRGMAFDKKNRLWLLSGSATLGYLDPDNFRYHPVKVNIPTGYSNPATAMFLTNTDEVMLIWVQQGYITYSERSGITDSSNNPFTLPKDVTPFHFYQDEKLNFWIGTSNGLVKYNVSKKILSTRINNTEKDPTISTFEKIGSINSVFVDRSNTCWVITWEYGLKVYSFNPATGKKFEWTNKLNQVVKRYYVPYGFNESTNGEIWLSGSELFCKLDHSKETVQSINQKSSAEYGILYDYIFSFCEDREKNIWLGTNRGLYRFNPDGQLFYTLSNKRSATETPVETEASDFLETQDGELIASSWGNGFFTYNQNFQPVPSTNLPEKTKMNPLMAWSMVQRPNGDIWCGMQNGAIFIFNGKGKTFRQELPALADGRTIRQLAQDSSGNIWVGTQAGAIIKWDATTEIYSKSLQVTGAVSRLFVDSSNQIWVGTEQDGLYILNSANGRVMQHYSSQGQRGQNLLVNGVSDILQYDDSTFYFGGNGLSILNTKTNRFRYFTVADGLPSANISNIVKDQEGYIWMTSGSGIINFHPVLKKLSHFDARDGVPNYNFNIGAAYVMKNGHILFGTNKEFLQFNPKELTKKVYTPPAIQIAGIKIMGITQNVDSLLDLPIIELESNQNSLTVFSATLRFKDVFTINYNLEGVDEFWRTADNGGLIEYNYLPPGKYTLKIACLQQEGLPGEIRSIHFRIAAPFYRTWWFYTIVALLIGALFFWIDRERIRRREYLYKIRTDIANNLHQEVNTALQNINILSEMAKIKADRDIDKSKEFIEQIHSKSHTMMLAMDDMLWSIDPANDSMEYTILRMQEFIDALSNRHEVHISLLVDEKIKKLKLNMQFRHDVFILFRESLRTIIAARVSDVKVHIAHERNNIVFTVESVNQLSDLQQLNNSLQSTELEQRIRSVKATLNTEVHKNTIVLILTVPVQ